MLGPGCHTPLPSCGASRATSESNLSSSGYSSGTSRCGSSNPLCISESEDTATPTSNTTTFFPGSHGLGFVRRPSPLLKSPSCDSESSDQQNYRIQRFGGFTSRTVGVFSRYRTDSETTDEQVPFECLNIVEEPPDSNDEGIGAELPLDAKSVPTTKEEKESPWTQQGLPEIVVQPCFTIHEQESTESTKSSRHNSMDEPVKSSSSSRSSSPAGSVQPSESEGASATGDAATKDQQQGGGPTKVEEGGGRGGRKSSPRRRGRRRKGSGSTSPAGNSRIGSPREGSSTERKAGQRLRSQVLKELICFCNVLQLKITFEGADRAASF